MGYGSLEAPPPKNERVSKVSEEAGDSNVKTGGEGSQVKTLDVGRGEYEGW